MKKAILYLFLMAGLVSCVEEMAPAVEETPAGVPMKFNFTVSEDLATKASKTAWAENDVIYVFFKGLGEKYLKLTYNGSGWDNASGGGTLLDTDFAALSDKTLTAVHLPVPVEVSYELNSDETYGVFRFTDEYGAPIMSYYMSEAGKAYTVDGSTVTASIALEKPEGVAQFHIAGLQATPGEYVFSCPLVAAVSCVGVSTEGSVQEEDYDADSGIEGFADADGAIFSGRLTTNGAADYTFTLTNGDLTYTLTRTNRTLVAGKMYNFPALDNEAWTETCNWDNNGKDYVDLGLPSGRLWATMNIGASAPSEDGNYFAWGETVQKESYYWDNYKYYDYDSGIISPREGITKYTGSDYSVLLAGDDAAYVNWGGDWRMPTDEEWRELKEYCTYQLIRQGERYVWIITGPNGNTMSLPGGGRYFEYNILDFNSQSEGFYWSSTLISSDILSAAVMNPTRSDLRMSDLARYMGAQVRPVLGEITSGEPDPDPDPSVDEDYVDLGLSSGLKWATRNVGATSSEGYGDLFAWGETETKADYSWDTYKFGTESSLTKYTEPSSTLLAGDDAAQVNWGDEWSIPTDADWAELISQCEWEKTEKNGVKGMLVTGPNGNSIFLPGSGYQNGTGILDRDDAFGYYWSSTLDNQFPDLGSYVFFNYNMGSYKSNSHSRYRGHSVRPVYRSIVSPEEGNTLNGHEYVDMGNGLKWATCNVGADSPEKFGGYFAWGETTEKNNYVWGTYVHRDPEKDANARNITKYTFADENTDGSWYDSGTFVGDGATTLAAYDYADDAARKNWGSTWRTPTKDEWAWLMANCNYEKTTDYNGTGVAGIIFTSRVSGYEDKQLFLPDTGFRNSTGTTSGWSFYWSSTLSESTSSKANYFYFYSGGRSQSDESRFFGCSVRPVSD